MTLDIRPLAEHDLPEADRIFRLAFGTFLGLPEPASFMGDADLVRPRWRAAPEAALGAFQGGELVGSVFAARWGSFGFFGPLTIRPDLWDQGVAKTLVDAILDKSASWGVRQSGLFTFADSPKHLGLYQSRGYWPGKLTAVMIKPVQAGTTSAPVTVSALPETDRATSVEACRRLTDAIFPGLDLISEILAVQDQGLGETVLIHEDGAMAGFAVMHTGAGSEAGSGAAFVKFAAVLPGEGAEARLAALLAACEGVAHARGASTLTAGVNTARLPAYQLMLASGFRAIILGVAMQRGDGEGFNRSDCFVLDDWR